MPLKLKKREVITRELDYAHCLGVDIPKLRYEELPPGMAAQLDDIITSQTMGEYGMLEAAYRYFFIATQHPSAPERIFKNDIERGGPLDTEDARAIQSAGMELLTYALAGDDSEEAEPKKAKSKQANST